MLKSEFVFHKMIGCCTRLNFLGNIGCLDVFRAFSYELQVRSVFIVVLFHILLVQSMYRRYQRHNVAMHLLYNIMQYIL